MKGKKLGACYIVDLGLIGYAEAYALQKRIAAARKADAIEDALLFCEHPHVITQGRNGKHDHLLVSDHLLKQRNVEFFETRRGGDITYHGPGQIVGYPILNLGAIRRDVVWYVRSLEEVMIRATADFGIAAGREQEKTGVWVASKEEDLTHRAQRTRNSQSLQREETFGDTTAEKIGAIGVHISRWVTSHGFAYNVSTDLRYFDFIVPCGIAGRKATSLEKLLGRKVERHEVAPRLGRHFGEVFGLEMREATKEELFEKLELAEQQFAVPA